MRPRLDDAVKDATAVIGRRSDAGLGELISPPGKRTAALCAAAVAAGIVLDRLAPLWGQIGAGVALWSFALVLLGRAAGAERRMLLACLVWATAGELFCSLGWGLYTYRLGNIPHFVPPGHVLVLLTGLQLAQSIPEAWAHRLTAIYAVLTVLAALFLGDQFSVLLFAVYAFVYWRAPAVRRLLAAMFAVTLTLELYGTSFGTWAWSTTVPVLGVTTTNPPLAVAAFYCVLDALVVWTMRAGVVRAAAAVASPRLAGKPA